MAQQYNMVTFIQIIATVTKNLVTITIIWVKVTILYCGAVFDQNMVNSINLFFPCRLRAMKKKILATPHNA